MSQVSQSWAGHPGSLVRTISLPGQPGAYLWGVKPDTADPTQSGFKFSNPGPISKDGMCVDFSVDDSSKEIHLAVGPAAGASSANSLQKCNESSPSQQFTLESNGNLHLTSGSKECFAVYALNGPAMVSFRCNGGSNEEFIFDQAKGTICSKNGYCFASRLKPPSGSGGVTGQVCLDCEVIVVDLSTRSQVWAKPQPNGATAVFVVNNSDEVRPLLVRPLVVAKQIPSSQTHTFEFALSDFNFTKSSASVFDIWNQKSIGTSGATYTTDPVESHDSRFYIFS